MPEPGSPLALWATTANYSPSTYPAEYPWPAEQAAGREAHPEAGNATPWSSTPRRNATGIAAVAAAGLTPGEGIPAESFNDWLGLASEWLEWLSENSAAAGADSHLIKTDANGHARILRALLGASDAAAIGLGVLGVPAGLVGLAVIDARNGNPVIGGGAALDVLVGSGETYPGVHVDHQADAALAIRSIAGGMGAIALRGEATGSGGLGLSASSALFHAAQFVPNATHAPILVAGQAADPSTLIRGGISFESTRQQLRTPNHVNGQMHSVMTANRGWHSFVVAGASNVAAGAGGPTDIISITIKNPISGTTYRIVCEADIRRDDGAASDSSANFFELDTKVGAAARSTIRSIGYVLEHGGLATPAARGQGHSFSMLITAASTDDIVVTWVGEQEAGIALDFLTPRITVFGDLSNSVV